MCVDTTLISGHSPFPPKPVLALCSPYESYQNQFWLYCPPIGRPFGALWALPSYWAALWRPMSSALLLGGPLTPFGRCPPIGRPFGAILAPPNHRAGLEAPFGECTDAHAQMPLRRSGQSLLRNLRTFILRSLCWAFIEVTPLQRNHTGHSQPCSFSYANHI